MPTICSKPHICCHVLNITQDTLLWGVIWEESLDRVVLRSSTILKIEIKKDVCPEKLMIKLIFLRKIII